MYLIALIVPVLLSNQMNQAGLSWIAAASGESLNDLEEVVSSLNEQVFQPLAFVVRSRAAVLVEAAEWTLWSVWAVEQ
jgi:hypothetical protein